MTMVKDDETGDNNRRQHERISDPAIKLKIAGKNYVSVNWSLGGFLIEGYDGALSTGALLTIEGISAANAKSMTPVAISARVVRSDSGNLALNILDIDSDAYQVLQEQMVKKMQALKT
ncbi:MAG: hypothetical protein ACTSV1_02525 [Alphaproteobacteria bacterium]